MTTKFRKRIGGGIYTTIAAANLIPATRLPCDIYFSKGGLITCLFMKRTIFSGKAQNIIKGKPGLYIRSEDRASFREYILRGGLEPSSAETNSGTKVPSYDLKELFQIHRNALVSHSKIPFNLYLKKQEDTTLLIEASEEKPTRVDELLLSAQGDILIGKSDISLYRKYMKQHTIELKTVSKRVESKVKATILRENSKLVMQEIFESPGNEELIKASQEEVNGIVDAVLKDKNILYDLIEIRNYDYYTYTHSVNVAVLAIGLGINAGLKRENIEHLGIGALLHDIGKSSIPNSLVNNPGGLDEPEFSIMKTHVTEGEKLLQVHAAVPPEAFPALLEHHEKLSGTGYPRGLTGSDISLFGRIAAIVDAYDALTTGRAYRAAFTPFYALSVLTQENHDYDRDILRTLIEMLGRVQ
jgi:HD-GYP domain-containing protein (c-di-GMP phosphodiesterase class II)